MTDASPDTLPIPEMHPVSDVLEAEAVASETSAAEPLAVETSDAETGGGETRAGDASAQTDLHRPVWYAVYVVRLHESRIKDKAEACGFECFMPMKGYAIETKGRLKKLIKPLLPGMVFLRVPTLSSGRFPAELSVSLSEIRLLGTRRWLRVPDNQMDAFRRFVDFGFNAIVLDESNLKPGARVKVVHGQFAGLEGELIRIKGHKRVVVRIEGLFALAADAYIPKEFLELI